MIFKVKDIIEFLNLELQKAKRDKPNQYRFIARAYNNTIQNIFSTFKKEQIINEQDIKSLNFTPHMKEKITNFMKKGKKVSKKELSKFVKLDKLRQELTGIMGLGEKKINELIQKGLTSSKDLQKKKYYNLLNTDTKQYLRYRPLKLIPHEDIKKLEPILTGFPDNEVILVGSYRRKRPYSRDIDIMLLDSDKTELEINKYLQYLENLPDIFIAVYSKGLDKASFFIKSKYHSRWFKADVFKTPKDEKIPMLLYSTGNKIFNIRMRAKAKRLGYLLNQKGLFENGKKIQVRDEKEIFDILKMEYTPPEQRNL